MNNLKAMIAMKETALIDYAKRREALGKKAVAAFLQKGEQLAIRTKLVERVVGGGAVVFPHAFLPECGEQVGAAIYAAMQGCLEGGKKRVLALGVVHPLEEQLREARRRELEGEEVEGNVCRGVFRREELMREYSLDNFAFLWKAKGLGLQYVERYPNLVNGEPATLPGMEELQELAKEAVVVATADLCHQGLAYGSEPFLSLEKGSDFARKQVKENVELLAGDDYLAYRKHAVSIKSDSKDVGQVLRYLLGPLQASILDFKLVDTSSMYEGDPRPSWVAASLVGLNR